jgi:hypothetical protein
MGKYRGKYTNARDCLHAETTEGLMVMVQVRETCHLYGNTHHLVHVAYCQNGCKQYQKAAQEAEKGEGRGKAVSYISQYTGESFGYEEERDGYDALLEEMQFGRDEEEQALADYQEECARQLTQDGGQGDE